MAIGTVNSQSNVSAVGGTHSTQGSTGVAALADATSTQMSSMTEMLKKLQQLQQDAPDQFKQVMNAVGTSLKAQAAKTGDKALGDLAERFVKSGQTGNLSLVQPPQGPPPEHSRVQKAYSAGTAPKVSPDYLANMIQSTIQSITGSGATATASL
jgi:hypothetical protein